MTAIHGTKTPVAWQQPIGTPRGNRLLGVYVSTAPDVLYPWDAAVVRAIRNNYDNEYVPLFQRKVYQTSTGGTFVLRAHGIGKQVDAPSGRVRQFTLLSVPVGYGSTWYPNACSLWMPVSWFQFGWHLFYDFRQIFVQGSVKEQEVVVDQPAEQRTKAAEDEHKESDYRVDHDEKHMKNLADKTSAWDLKALDGVERPAPKPYVFHGGKKVVA